MTTASNKGASAAGNGMSGLQIMPFPFLNPWNWGAMTPWRTLAASAVMTRCSLDLCRLAVDASRAAVRAQQDALLRIIEARNAEARDGKLSAEEEAEASVLASPVLASLSAFTAWNDAILRADGVSAAREIAD